MVPSHCREVKLPYNLLQEAVKFMDKISILYPNLKDHHFDMEYYVNKHMRMTIDLLSIHPGYRGVSVERGLHSGAPDLPVTYIVMCHFLFDSYANFKAAFDPHTELLRGDIPNYTDIKPVFQVSEVVMSG